jgi:hypothetical protein
MAGERIRDLKDAQHLRDQYHVVHPGTSDVTVRVGPKADHLVSGAAMDGFQLDPDELRKTAGDLDSLRGKLQEHLDTAERELTQHLPDGTSPIAAKMRWVFLDRADQSHGLPAVLRGYLNEVDKIRTAIQATLATHQQRDLDAADAVHKAGRTEGH